VFVDTDAHLADGLSCSMRGMLGSGEGILIRLGVGFGIRIRTRLGGGGILLQSRQNLSRFLAVAACKALAKHRLLV